MNLKAMKQGQLDGLCGLYSVINAMIYLKCIRSNDESRTLFKKLAIHRKGIVTSALYDGVKIETVEDWLKEAAKLTKSDITISRPYIHKKFKSPSEYVKTITPHLKDRNTIVLVGIGEPWFHWTLIKSLRNGRFQLFDSYGYKKLDTARLLIKKSNRAGVRIATHETIIIKKNT